MITTGLLYSYTRHTSSFCAYCRNTCAGFSLAFAYAKGTLKRTHKTHPCLSRYFYNGFYCKVNEYPRDTPLPYRLPLLLLLEACALVPQWGLTPRSSPFVAIGWWSLAFLIFAVALLHFVPKKGVHPGPHSPQDRPLDGDNSSRLHLPLTPLHVLWGGAIALRLVGLAIPPGFSDDLYRYLWEGHVGLQGFNPLLFPPNSPALDSIALPLREAVNHPHIPSVYPPLAQALFQMLAAVWATPLAVKVVFAACDLTTVGLIISLLRQRGRSLRWAALYAWHPLPVLEFAGSGHLDSAGILLWIGALVLLRPTLALSPPQSPEASRAIPLEPARLGRDTLAALLFTASALIKFLTLPLLPAIWLALLRRHRPMQVVGITLVCVVFCLMCIALFVPLGPLIPAPGTAPLHTSDSGLNTYAEHWRFNPSGFALLEFALSLGGGDLALARPLTGALFGLLVLVWTLQRIEPLVMSWHILVMFFLLSPTAHPWYLCWSLAFLPFFPRIDWMVLSGTVILAYLAFSGVGGWAEPAWLPYAVYGPALLLIPAQVLHVYRKDRPPAPPTFRS